MFCAAKERHVFLCWHKAGWFFELHRTTWFFLVAQTGKVFGGGTILNVAGLVAVAFSSRVFWVPTEQHVFLCQRRAACSLVLACSSQGFLWWHTAIGFLALPLSS